MNVSNVYFMPSHAVTSIGEWMFLSAIRKLVEFSFYNLWEFKEACESSELITNNECGISFPRDYEECSTHLWSVRLWM